MATIRAERYHDISCGHRVHGHEGKCRHLHGHNYRIHFVIESEDGTLDSVGRVMDFSVIKKLLCMWLEDVWDHKMLMWDQDPYGEALKVIDDTVVLVPFNPTAENIGWHLLSDVAPRLLFGTGARLVECRVEETRKCSVVVKAA